MKTYKIPVEWVMVNDMEIKAESLDRAIEKAETQGGIPLEGAEYLGNSFKVNVECAIALNPTKGEINEKVIRVNKKKIDISDKSRRTIF